MVIVKGDQGEQNTQNNENAKKMKFQNNPTLIQVSIIGQNVFCKEICMWDH